MARGIYRGKVAALGYAAVAYTPVTTAVSDLTIYTSQPAWDADWTAVTQGGASSIGGSGPWGDGDIKLTWNGTTGETDGQYYWRNIGGLTPGQRYLVRITIAKTSGFDLRGTNVLRIAGTLAGSGIPNSGSLTGARYTVQRTVTADGAGQFRLEVGSYQVGAAANGTTHLYGIEVVPLVGATSSALLTFYADKGQAWPVPRAQFAPTHGESGTRRTHVYPGTDYRFRCLARRIPTTGGVMDDGQTISGWDAWQAMLANALDMRALTFYPDASDLTTFVTPVYLAETDLKPPEKDGVSRWQTTLDLVSPTTPFVGY